MPEPDPAVDEALQQAKIEIRDLRAMIAALRDELEAREQAADKHLEEARAQADDEIRDLQAMIVRLRLDMERTTAQTEERIHQATRELRDTVEHHIQTIRILRERLAELSGGKGGDR